MLTDENRAEQLTGLPCGVLSVDASASAIDLCPENRPKVDRVTDALCYIIYTSGTTGRPKGVAVNHSSICNFLEVCSPIYRYTATDRVYQGMTIAFDFSIEEIWPTLFAGGTIVVGPNDHRRIGSGLAEFLIEKQVTVMCCVPTLLATLDRDIPSLRLLLVGGEACPRDLVQRWSRPGRRMLNTYGPTEATVTATWTELLPDRPVTIGRPLPTYTVHILDERRQPVPDGQTGEICIGGPGVARGYVNRPDLTADRFIPNTFDAPTPGATLYRTGDLGRYTPDHEIEYLGRMDGQVKIRGYRIELSEIEAVLLEDKDIELAVVVKVSLDHGVDDLVAYLTLRNRLTDREPLQSRLQEALLKRLPAYMVPAFLEIIDELPTLASGKVDRSKLPPPRSQRLSPQSGSHAPPVTSLETQLAQVWGDVLHRENPSVEADFFIDLGGHSLFAAGVISQLRKIPAFRQLAISELYAHPTIRSLARHIESSSAATAIITPANAPAAARVYHSNARVFRCGTAQMGLMYLVFLLFAIPTALQFSGRGHFAIRGLFRSALLYGPVVLPLALTTLPILAKRLLIGRFRAGRYPLWGWFYCRFWLYRKIMSFSPLDVLAGSPLLPIYARLLGMKIGRRCQIATGLLEVPDLIDIGDDVSIGYGSQIQPYTIENGVLEFRDIQIHRHAFIGANVVVMPGARIGEGSRVVDQSLVARDQIIPGHQTWAGSPASHVAGNVPLLHEMHSRSPAVTQWPAWLIVGFILAFFCVETLPLLAIAPGMWLFEVAFESKGPWVAMLSAIPAGLIYVLSVCALVAVGKRLIMRRAKAGIFPLRSFMGFRKWVADKLMDFSLASTNTLYATLYTLPWLRLLGARIGARSEVSTVSHIDPDLLTIGTESFVADDASVGGATYYNGFVSLGTSDLGNRCFVGNSSLVPGNTRLGDNSLLGVQSVPPGPVMEAGTSWLGSPAMYLPRRQIDESFDESVTYNPTPKLIAIRLSIEFLRVMLPSVLLHALLFTDLIATLWLAAHLSAWPLALVLPLLYIGSAALAIGVVIAMKWIVVGRYVPRVAPNWSHFVWRTELITGLYESVALPSLFDWLTGTPLLPWALRLLGTRMGRRIYLDSTYITEFDLVHVADDTEISNHTSLQTHLFEDRVMKMSNVTIGAGCFVGPRSVVLYDSNLEPGCRLDALSLVMKGESLPAQSYWRGIPARPVQS